MTKSTHDGDQAGVEPKPSESRHGKIAPGMTVVGFVTSLETKAWLQEKARLDRRTMSNYLNILLEEKRAAEEAHALAESQSLYGKPQTRRASSGLRPAP